MDRNSAYFPQQFKSALLLLLLVPCLISCQARQFVSKPKSESSLVLVDQLEPSGDWSSLRAKREKAYADYISSDKHGREVDWFINKPLGINGVPYLVLRVLIEMYPDIWTKNGSLGDLLGFGPHPDDYEGGALQGWGGALKPAAQRHALPFGVVSDADFTNDKGSIPGSQNVFFSCAACHTSRVMKDGKIRYYLGGSNNEIEPQMYGTLLYRSAAKLSNVGTVKDLSKIKPNALEVAKLWFNLVRFDCKKYRPELPDQGVSECREQKTLLLEGSPPATKKDGSYDENSPSNKAELEATLGSLADKTEPVRPTFVKAAKGFLNATVFKKGSFHTTVSNLLGTGAKSRIMMYDLGETYGFAPAGRSTALKAVENDLKKESPAVAGPRPGQMDALGLVTGIVYLNALRPDHLMFRYFPNHFVKKYSADVAKQDTSSADYKLGLKYAAGETEMSAATGFEGTWNKEVSAWISQSAALSDIKSLFLSKEDVVSNWDGRLGATTRSLASGLSSVGDPTKVFIEIHETSNSFINELPNPPYPFEDVDADQNFYSKALAGQKLYNESCAQCHHVKNDKIYNVGTDMARAHVVHSEMARVGLVALGQASCEWAKQRELLREANGEPRMDGQASGKDKDGKSKRYWCEPELGSAQKDRDEYTSPYMGSKAGYKADTLRAIWMDGPYLHNGSVPSLRDLFAPATERPKSFYRGNINFDTKNVGFVLKEPSRSKENLPSISGSYQASDAMNGATFNSALRGNSNSGHEYFHRNLKVDELGNRVEGTPWSAQETEEVISYMKTL